MSVEAKGEVSPQEFILLGAIREEGEHWTAAASLRRAHDSLATWELGDIDRTAGLLIERRYVQSKTSRGATLYRLRAEGLDYLKGYGFPGKLPKPGMNTTEAIHQLIELAEHQGTRSLAFRTQATELLRRLWEAGYEFGKEQS